MEVFTCLCFDVVSPRALRIQRKVTVERARCSAEYISTRGPLRKNGQRLTNQRALPEVCFWDGRRSYEQTRRRTIKKKPSRAGVYVFFLYGNNEDAELSVKSEQTVAVGF